MPMREGPAMVEKGQQLPSDIQLAGWGWWSRAEWIDRDRMSKNKRGECTAFASSTILALKQSTNLHRYFDLLHRKGLHAIAEHEVVTSVGHRWEVHRDRAIGIDDTREDLFALEVIDERI